MTQSELAERIDVSLRTIGDIETGKRNPTFEVLFKLINVLDIPADLIFRPDKVTNEPEVEQFISEFSAASNEEKKIVMAAARAILNELHIN